MTFAPQRRPSGTWPGLRRIVYWVLIAVVAGGIWRESPGRGTRVEPDWLTDFLVVLAFFGAWTVLYTLWEIAVPWWPALATPEYRRHPGRAAVPSGFRWLEVVVLAIVAGAFLWSKRPDSAIHVGLRQFVDAFALIGASALIGAIWQTIARRRPPTADQANGPIA